MAKTKLSIFLLREDVEKTCIIKSGAKSVKLSDGNILYYKSNKASEPKWIESFFGGGLSNTEPFKTKSISAVILYDVKIQEGYNRMFAVVFGYGRCLLNSGVFEERFGLITTLNSIDSKQLRSIDINSIESVPLNNRIQSSALAGISNFNIDVDKDILKSVAGRSSEKGLDGTLSGADSLSVCTDQKYDNLECVLLECFKKFKSSDYKANFEWIDKIKYVKEQSTISKLDNALISEMNKPDISKLWVSIPEIFDWNNADSFQIKGKKSYDDIDVEKIKSELNCPLTLNNLKNNRLSVVDGNGDEYKSWTLYKCIYADIEQDGKQYLLNDGKWYEVADGFVKQVNAFYDVMKESRDSKESDLEIPDYSFKLEEEYNASVEKSNPEEYTLMDRKTISIGGNAIEFCDIYSKHKQFIHVKRYSGSAVLSHLFFQGLVSAESFFDRQFRCDVNKKLKKDFQVSENDTVNANEYEVVYVIARKNSKLNAIPDMPFFSKVAFRNVAKRLKMYGYKVRITGVPYTYNESKDNNENS